MIAKIFLFSIATASSAALAQMNPLSLTILTSIDDWQVEYNYDDDETTARIPYRVQAGDAEGICKIKMLMKDSTGTWQEGAQPSTHSWDADNIPDFNSTLEETFDFIEKPADLKLVVFDCDDAEEEFTPFDKASNFVELDSATCVEDETVADKYWISANARYHNEDNPTHSHVRIHYSIDDGDTWKEFLDYQWVDEKEVGRLIEYNLKSENDIDQIDVKVTMGIELDFIVDVNCVSSSPM